MIYFMEHLKIENKMDDFQGYPKPLGNLHLGKAWLAGAFKIFEIFCLVFMSFVRRLKFLVPKPAVALFISLVIS